MRIKPFDNPALFLVIALAISLMACSTKKNTFSRRVYHNLTAHYNAYFNGNESMKEGVKTLESKHVDDYSMILPVYKLGQKQDAQAIFPQMDRAYTKASKVIQRHSMFIKGTEYNRWIDDAYMMIAKSQFHKHDFRTAISTFDYVLRQYPQSELLYDAMLYKVLSWNYLEKYSDAEDIMRKIDENTLGTSKSKFFLRNKAMVYADHYLKRSNYEKATPYLEEAFKANKKRHIKNRIAFIQGQIYQQRNELSKAVEKYSYVLRKRPEYVMEFNSSLNLANCYDVNSGNSESIKKKLSKMIRDKKNKDYLDQIYYVLGQIELREKDTVKAIESFKLSARNSVTNVKQKSMSYLIIADLYFNQLNYEKAQIYYDSTIAFLPKDYKDYKTIESKKNVLNDLVQNIQQIRNEDSLQRLAKMSEAERDTFIADLIKQLKKEEEERQRIEQERLEQMALNNINQTETQSKVGGKWYFYNPVALSQGFNEFKRKWGNRKLEDNWRLSNKQQIDFTIDDGGESPDSAGNETKNQSTVSEDKNFYLKNIPLTDSMMQLSNTRIQDAYYNLGIIYNEGLNNYEKSSNSYETLIQRYSTSDFHLKTYYQLYRLHLKNNNNPRAEYYKNLIISQYPDSDYAKIIEDPDYNKVIEKQRNAAEIFYASTYNYYTDNRLSEVLKNCNTADSLYKSSEAISKFVYLKALAYAKQKNTNDFVATLEYLVKEYPDSEQKPIAEKTLKLLNERLKGDSTFVIGDSVSFTKKQYPYKYNTQTIHFYVCVVDIMKVDINKLKIAFSNFNTEYFRLTKLKISNLFLDDRNQLITISNFPDSERAMIYFNAVKQEPEVFGQFPQDAFVQFVITTENYPIFYRNKDIKTYSEFFSEYYLQDQ